MSDERWMPERIAIAAAVALDDGNPKAPNITALIRRAARDRVVEILEGCVENTSIWKQPGEVIQMRVLQSLDALRAEED